MKQKRFEIKEKKINSLSKSASNNKLVIRVKDSLGLQRWNVLISIILKRSKE